MKQDHDILRADRRSQEKQEQVVRLPARYRSPLYFLIAMAVTVFLVDAFVMLALTNVPRFPDAFEAIFDALVMTAVVTPILYYFLVRPLTHNIEVRAELEEQIEKSLDRRSRQVRMTTEIAQEIAAVPDLDNLFREVVELIQKRFGYYHVHIYLLDERRLILKEGTGEAGRKMKDEGHQIPLSADVSLVARSARTGDPVRVNDVSQDRGFLPNKHLPNTKSEIAVPIHLGGKVLGVLDIQSDKLDTFDGEDEIMLTGLCGQIAVAIDDRRAEAERKKAEETLEKTQQEEERFEERLRRLLEAITRLAGAQTLDDLCRQAVETGRAELGFDRLGLWFFDADDPDTMVGTFGTDRTGATRDERTWRRRATDQSKALREAKGLRVIHRHGPILDGDEEVEMDGERVIAPITEADNIVGLLSTDNVLNHRPLTRQDEEILALYASAVGYLCSHIRAEGGLREREEEFRLAFENAVDAIIWADTETGQILNCNKAMEALLEKSREEIVGQHQTSLHPPSLTEHYTEFFKGHVRRKRAYHEEAEVITKSGAVKPVHVTASVTRIGEKSIIQGIFRDITEWKKMQEEIQKAQKLESIGVLAGGVAHDFNNLLTGILGNVTLGKMHTKPGEKVHDNLAAAEKAAWRARHLTQQLLTFAKGGIAVKETVAIGDLLNSAARFALSGRNSRCEFDIPDALWLIHADQWQITQVINNLIANADEAMPNGGTITLRAENTTVGPEHALPIPNGKYVKISVVDQGIGIPKEHLNKVFDPYFSTKQSASGLGLSASYSIVKKHDGHISIDSQLGRGTAVHVYLPASENQVVEKLGPTAEPFLDGARVLVMDDEEVVLNVADGFLTHLGAKVTSCKDGREAIALFQKAKDDGQPFGLVILDLTVPGGMGGHDAVRKLIEIDPDVRAIVSSGYSNDPIMSDFARHGFHAALTKPYELTELKQAVRAVLARGGA
ncbi:MAG: GAF domain-containing protein [Planctomycetota bacterium]